MFVHISRPLFECQFNHCPASLGTVKSDLGRDMDELRRLAFRRVEKVGSLLKELHAARAANPRHNALPALEVVRQWLLMPFTLWPVDFVGLGKHLVAEIQNGREPQAEVLFLVENVSEMPPLKAQCAIAEHELEVEKGHYEWIIKPNARLKFDARQDSIRNNSKFRAQWRNLKTLFDIDTSGEKKRVIRRRMVQERSFRHDWDFIAGDRKKLFKAAFDAFCHRWNLYGMEGDEPLVLKLSVNVTPHGTMIVIPVFWSFDRTRDLEWGKIMKLHRSRVIVREGPVLSMSRIARRRLAEKTLQLWRKLKQNGLKGDELYQQIKKTLGLSPSFTDREIRRLKKQAGDK